MPRSRSNLPCPKCGCRSYVKATQLLATEGHEVLRRYKYCKDCGATFVTDETYGEYWEGSRRQPRTAEPWYMQGAFKKDE